MKTSDKNIILTGIPRSGTTLCCFLLSKLDDTLALNEPIRTISFKNYQHALDGTSEYFNSSRKSILEKGIAVARAEKGKITDNHFITVKGIRKKVVKKQEIKIEKSLTENFKLVIKHNALFTILLPDLIKSFPCYAIVRNPLSVLGSWNSLDLPVSKGQVRAAQWLYPELPAALEKIKNKYDRQIHILDWYYQSYKLLPAECVIRYEDIIESNGQALSPISNSANSFSEELTSKNKNPVYDHELMKMFEEKLNQLDHGCWHFYSNDSLTLDSISAK